MMSFSQKMAQSFYAFSYLRQDAEMKSFNKSQDQKDQIAKAFGSFAPIINIDPELLKRDFDDV